MDFYEPTILFRQNAIRRNLGDGTVSPCASWADYLHSNSTASLSWLLNNDNSLDVELMNKVCLLDRLNIKSNYWKIPDANMNLTALALSDCGADTSVLAISLANAESNLFIYELDSLNNYLTHQTTISLPDIHGLAWVPGTSLRFLVLGNNKGYAHLVLVPNSEDGEECAEIVKRFNHRKHLKSVNKDPSVFSHADTCVLNLAFVNSEKLATAYDGTLFVWNMNDVELSVRPRPESILVVPGLRGLDPSRVDPQTLALCGAFGVSLFDTRAAHHSVPQENLHRSRKQVAANIVRWHSEHTLAAAHGDGVVRLWDVRKNDSFAELTGHQGKTVTAMEWNGNDLFTGANDGNIVHWDLTSDLAESTSGFDFAQYADKLERCSLKEGFSSVRFDAVTNSLVHAVSERQCGTVLPALNNQIVGMCLLGEPGSSDCKLVLIDGAAFLGLHSRIYEAAGAAPAEKAYYSQDDLALISKRSDSTLVDSSDSLVAPLTVKKTNDFAANLDIENSPPHKPLGAHRALARALSVVHCSEADFDFAPRRTSVVSLHLIDLLPDMHSSPSSLETLHNDSVYTLSTNATIIEEQTVEKDMLFSFLDLELVDICDRFRTTNSYLQ